MFNIFGYHFNSTRTDTQIRPTQFKLQKKSKPHAHFKSCTLRYVHTKDKFNRN